MNTEPWLIFRPFVKPCCDLETTLSAAMGLFKYSWLDFLFTCLGLLVLLVDIVLDTLAVVTFYQEKAYMCLGLLLIFLLGSSFIVQVYSWLWYSDGSFKRETLVARCFSLKQLKLLHVLQLGIYFRLCESADFMLLYSLLLVKVVF